MTTPASTKQITLIESLRAERIAPAFASVDVNTLTIREASDLITKLFAAPKAPKAAAPAASGMGALLAAFERVAVSRYAVPTEGLMIPGTTFTGDLAFFDVRNFKGRKYLNQLHGAPGDARRSRLPLNASIAILGVIAGRHVEYAQAYGREFGCCGRCGAALTDQRSRETNLGPECRKIFGL